MARWISNRKKVVMHRTIPILASLAVIVVLASSAQAQTAATDRYCLQGRRWGFPGNCQFATHEQCRVAAAGTHASCGLNPRYAARRR
jgi:hypothetical protein